MTHPEHLAAVSTEIDEPYSKHALDRLHRDSVNITLAVRADRRLAVFDDFNHGGPFSGWPVKMQLHHVQAFVSREFSLETDGPERHAAAVDFQ